VIPGMKPTPGAFAARRRLAVLHQAPKHHHSKPSAPVLDTHLCVHDPCRANEASRA
jgi:hypothetical protein